jgi:hypothetical protein
MCDLDQIEEIEDIESKLKNWGKHKDPKIKYAF